MIRNKRYDIAKAKMTRSEKSLFCL